MLFSQAAMTFLVAWDRGDIPTEGSDATSVHDLTIALFQSLTRTLQAQNEDGSWACRQAEPTSYALLTLVSLFSLPIAAEIRPQIVSAIKHGRKFLSSLPSESEGDYVWIEKLSYRMRTLHQAYVLAALHAPVAPHSFGQRCSQTFRLPLDRMDKLGKLAERLPLFADLPSWTLKASLIEGNLFLPQLRAVRLKIFPRKNMAEDKYFDYIPFAWTTSNNFKKAHLRSTFLCEMMIVSFLNYQVDEYMETVVSGYFYDRLVEAKDLIKNLFHQYVSRTNERGTNLHEEKATERGCPSELTNGNNVSKKRKLAYDGSRSTDDNEHKKDARSEREDQDVVTVLGRFIEHILDHPNVQTASDYDRGYLRQELETFLLAHVDQIEDNRRLAQGEGPPGPPSGRLFDWVRRTASDHTSCPYSFRFAVSLMGQREDFFCSGSEKYIAQAACRHLATLCRMCNDIGSLARDRQEANLNSLDFPELRPVQIQSQDVTAKDQLYRLASYERQCLDLTMGELNALSSASTTKFMETFISVTDMFGQIYMEKDIASRMK